MRFGEDEFSTIDENDEQNARRLSDFAVSKVAESLKAFGWRQPIVVDREGVIVVGHTRLLAAQSLNQTTVPVHVAAGLTPEQAKAYRLMDNRSADESTWNDELLQAEMTQLQGLGIDLALTGFSELEIEEILRPTAKTDEDAAPDPPERAASAAGDVWLLGGHRVMCGDATAAGDVEKLLRGKKADLAFSNPSDAVDGLAPEEDERADMVFTDPPYNSDYEGYTKQKLKMARDRQNPEQFRLFLRAAFAVIAGAIKPTASLYACYAVMYHREFQDAIEAAGFTIRCQLVWTKNTFAWGYSRYKWQHEPMFYAHRNGQSDKWYGDKTQSTIWAASKPGANRLHPTMKPIELIERALANSSQPGQIVLDLFGGSGSTLIAAEKTSRRARLMELDPRYADVIVTRWQEYTGAEATLEADGRRFAEIKAARAQVAQAA